MTIEAEVREGGTDNRPKYLRDEAQLVILEEGIEDLSSKYTWVREVIGIAHKPTGEMGFRAPYGGAVVAQMELQPEAEPHRYDVFGRETWDVRYFQVLPGDDEGYDLDTGFVPIEAVLTSTIVPGLPAAKNHKEAKKRAKGMGINDPEYGIGNAEE